jgi:alkylated DNA repair dioxygenase AlkB
MHTRELFDEDAEAVDLPDAILTFHRTYFSAQDAGRLAAELLATTRWRQDRFTIYGRSVLIPRLNAWYGDPGRVYRYSGITLDPLAWTAPLREIRERLAATTGVQFNSVLLNLYRDGRDSVAWHADDERELGPEPLIASVSLGASRTFQLRRKDDRSRRHAIELTDGSMLLMSGSTQAHWMHQVPKTTRPVGPRLNLTFRSII